MISRDRFVEILNERKCPYKISKTGHIRAYVPRDGAKYWRYLPDMPDYATVLVACEQDEAKLVRLFRDTIAYPDRHDIYIGAGVDAGCNADTLQVKAYLAIDFESEFSIEDAYFIHKDLYLCLLRQFRDMLDQRIINAQPPIIQAEPDVEAIIAGAVRREEKCTGGES